MENKSKIFIPAQALTEFVKKNEVAWQMCDSLIEFTHTNDYMSTKYYNDDSDEMFEILASAKECVVIDPNVDNCNGFEDLIEWSEGKDLLILVDDLLLLCIAQCDKDKVLSFVA